MYELKDYQSLLREKAAKAETFFTKYPDVARESAERFRDINDTKIKNGQPEIMVYGIYNAGKSSILNELMGKDEASVADKPETHSITYYEWQGYKFADTPGVGAPEDDEKVTEEHLRKADIVLFVMSTTGSSEKRQNYERMKAIADSGKKIIIVLNDKNGDLGVNDADIQIIKQKVDANMRQLGIDNVDKRYCIVTINAARARQGRLKGKPGLIEKSCIADLKGVILSELAKTTSFDVLRQAVSDIENILDTFIKGLQTRENSETLKKMSRVLETFDKEKRSMGRQINLFIDMQTDNLASSLPQKIWNLGGNAAAAENLVNGEIEELSQKVQTELQQQIEDALAVLTLELKSFVEVKTPDNEADRESLKNVVESLTLKMNEINGSNDLPVEVTSSDNSAADIATTAKAATAILAASGKEIVGTLAKTAIGKTIAKTAAGKLISKVATSVVPVIGPVITVVSVLGTLKDILGNNKEYEAMQRQIEQRNEAERKRIEAAKQARQELDQKCLYMANNVARSLKENVGKVMREILTEYEEPFKAAIEARKKNGDALMDDAEKVRALKDEYSAIRVELGGH